MIVKKSSCLIRTMRLSRRELKEKKWYADIQSHGTQKKLHALYTIQDE